MGAHSEPQSWYNYFKLKTFEIQPMQKKKKKLSWSFPYLTKHSKFWEFYAMLWASFMVSEEDHSHLYDKHYHKLSYLSFVLEDPFIFPKEAY